MKKILRLFVLILCIGLIISGCEKENDTNIEKSEVVAENTKGPETSVTEKTDTDTADNTDVEEDTKNIPEGAKSGFVLLSDVVPDAILEIRYYSTYNFVGERIEGYEQPVALATKEAAEALKKVSDDVMSQGYRLKIFDMYRPKTAVSHFVRWAENTNDIKMKDYFYPELDKSVLFKKGYISSKSGHSRGSTVDLTLFDMKTGKEVDMGAPFDFFGDISHPSNMNVTNEQYENRMILQKAMVKHGFKSMSTEWWHFTLKNEPYPDTYFDFPVNVSSVK